MARAQSAPADSPANPGFETKLWLSADKLRNKRNAAFSPSKETARAVTDLASGEGVARTVNNCCCGTDGRLTLTKDRIQQVTH